ncbi:protein DUF4411 [Candidatus Termititenax persephonae]|uniref:Protein DUF4411 n=1 Tax=Candidatus Termititenax persephonae TaxID=2218525 RepID=A0A388THM2_9BACT|nr:protein DUF4411 [Candidatus Termititenax persephonae]
MITKYLIDTNILIEAHRRYYAFDICSGFWDFITIQYKNNTIRSIDKVRNELKTGDNLDIWVTNNLPKDFFCSTEDIKVAEKYSQIIRKIEAQHYNPNAKAIFADNADSWLIAYALAHDFTIVTMEVLEPNIKKSVKIPNVCKDFNIQYINTYDLLRNLKGNFKLQN